MPDADDARKLAQHRDGLLIVHGDSINHGCVSVSVGIEERARVHRVCVECRKFLSYILAGL